MTTKRIKAMFYLAIMMLIACDNVNAQAKPVYTKYVNTFIGTAPLTDPKILGYELPKGWRSWAGLSGYRSAVR